MSLKQSHGLAVNSSVYTDTPSAEWQNGNNAVFGGWTMFKACEVAIIHANTFSAYNHALDDLPEVPEFQMQDFQFLRPGKVGVPIRFDVSSDKDGIVSVVATDQCDDRILEASFRCSAQVAQYTEAEMVKLLEVMSLLDMEGGRATNIQHPHRDSQVCVTASIKNLSLYDVGAYRSRLPEGRFDLMGFREARIQNAQDLGRVDGRYFCIGEQVSESLRSVTMEIGCAEDGLVFAHVGGMTFVNVDRHTQKSVPMLWRAAADDIDPDEPIGVKRA